MAKYKIELKGNISLALAEMGVFLPHNTQIANSPDHAAGTDLVIQWVLIGDVGSCLALSYENSRGTVDIVKKSMISNPSGILQSGAVFKSP